MHLNYSPYGVTASVLASIVLMSFITFARADDKKFVMLAKGTLIEIQLSFDKCYLTMKEADLFYRFGEIAKSKSTIDELFRCVENAPTKVKSSVDALRSALASKPQALATLKEYVLTYRRLLAPAVDVEAERDLFNYVELVGHAGGQRERHCFGARDIHQTRHGSRQPSI